MLHKKAADSSDKPQDHVTASQQTHGHVRAARRMGESYNQSEVFLWLATQFSSKKCKHSLPPLRCKECFSKQKMKMRRKKEIRQRVKALNQELLHENNNKTDKADKPRRSPKVRFDMEGVPFPIKEREMLYDDYYSSGSGMLEQWANRLQELRGDQRALTEELESMAASAVRSKVRRSRAPLRLQKLTWQEGELTEELPQMANSVPSDRAAPLTRRESGGRWWWCTCCSVVVFASMLVLALLLSLA